MSDDGRRTVRLCAGLSKKRVFFNIAIFLFTVHLSPKSQRNDYASEKPCNALVNNCTVEGVQQRDEDNEITKCFCYLILFLGLFKKKVGERDW